MCVPFEVTFFHFCLFTLTLQAPGRAHRLYKHHPMSVNYKNYNSFLTVKVKQLDSTSMEVLFLVQGLNRSLMENLGVNIAQVIGIVLWQVVPRLNEVFTYRV